MLKANAVPALLLGLNVLLSAAGCGSHASVSETQSFVENSSLWPDPKNIPVCWENPGAASDELKTDLKNWVVNEYKSKTQVNFVGWADCTDADLKATIIRVHFNPTWDWAGNGGLAAGGGLSWVGPAAGGLGGTGGQGTTRIDISKDGNFPPKTNGLRDWAIGETRATMVHEFGHAIGLNHEQSRLDAPDCKNDAKANTMANSGSNVFVGKYDPYSIMNYCTQADYTKAQLSTGDVDGIDYLYPAVGQGSSRQARCSSSLATGEALTRNQKLCSNNGKFQLIMQDDGNLVSYTKDKKTVVWASSTNGKPVARARMQTDGDLVLDDGAEESYWDSKTKADANAIADYFLLLEDDGNLTVRKTSDFTVIWAAKPVAAPTTTAAM